MKPIQIERFLKIREIKLLLAILFSIGTFWYLWIGSYFSIIFFVLAIIWWIDVIDIEVLTE